MFKRIILFSLFVFSNSDRLTITCFWLKIIRTSPPFFLSGIFKIVLGQIALSSVSSFSWYFPTVTCFQSKVLYIRLHVLVFSLGILCPSRARCTATSFCTNPHPRVWGDCWSTVLPEPPPEGVGWLLIYRSARTPTQGCGVTVDLLYDLLDIIPIKRLLYAIIRLPSGLRFIILFHKNKHAFPYDDANCDRLRLLAHASGAWHSPFKIVILTPWFPTLLRGIKDKDYTYVVIVFYRLSAATYFWRCADTSSCLPA